MHAGESLILGSQPPKNFFGGQPPEFLQPHRTLEKRYQYADDDDVVVDDYAFQAPLCGSSDRIISVGIFGLGSSRGVGIIKVVVVVAQRRLLRFLTNNLPFARCCCNDADSHCGDDDDDDEGEDDDDDEDDDVQ